MVPPQMDVICRQYKSGTAQHSTAQNSTAQHSIHARQRAAQHGKKSSLTLDSTKGNTTQCNATQHNTTQPNATQRNPTQSIHRKKTQLNTTQYTASTAKRTCFASCQLHGSQTCSLCRRRAMCGCGLFHRAQGVAGSQHPSAYPSSAAGRLVCK